MKRLDTLLQRIDRLSLRERVILFLAIAVLMLAVADQLAISPALQASRQAQREVQTEAAALGALRSQLQALSRPVAPGEAAASSPQHLQAQLTRLGHEREALLAQLHPAAGAVASQGARLPELLNHVLRRQPQVSLQGLDTHPTASADGASSPAAQAPGWQSAELHLSGRYGDLLRFVTDLEESLPGMRWGPLRLDAQSAPAHLVLTLWMPGATP